MKDKILLITGGTGSFGNAVLRKFLPTDIKEIRKQWQIDKTFSPAIAEKETRVLVKGWKRAVKAAESWAEE